MKQSIIGEIYDSWTKGELKKLNKFISTSHWSKSETIQLCHSCLASYSSKEKLEQLRGNDKDESEEAKMFDDNEEEKKLRKREYDRTKENKLRKKEYN